MEHKEASMNKLLEDAAVKGDVTLLQDLITQDPLLLHRQSTTKTLPLHVSSRLGHVDFTSSLLHQNPNLAYSLDPSDNSTALHVASRNNHLVVVKSLLSVNPTACLARNSSGMNPAHVAAMMGHVAVLQEIIRTVPAAARMRVGRGESLLHLCVEFDQLEAMRAVVETVAAGEAGMLLNANDGDGNTVLHIAVAQNRPQIIHFLLNDNRVKKNLQNEYGLTPLDIFTENNKHNNPATGFPTMITLKQANLLSSTEISKKKEQDRQSSLIETQRSSLMVVASLVATMAFQAGLTPPLLHYKETPKSNTKAADFDSHYSEFIVLNTIGLFSSMSSIILLISGLPGRRFFMVLVLVMMFVAVTCMTYVYGISLHAFTLAFSLEVEAYRTLMDFYMTFTVGFYSWACVMAMILVGHLSTWTVRFCKKC